MDIVGHFPKVAGNRRYLLVDTDYFTKWVEAEPLANIKDVDAKRFVEATQEADPCLTKPLPRDPGGQTYRRKHKNM